MDKLRLWQERLANNENAYLNEIALMDKRERLYKGLHELEPIIEDQTKTESNHLRNIVAEMIESQVDSSIPMPKVTPRRKEDEARAKLIEDMIRNELDRLPMEELNDQLQRTVPIQGGGFLLVEWDNTIRTHNTIGEVCVGYVHPKQVVPQDGVYTSVEDMDYIILKVPQTKEYIKQRYNVDVYDENESDPEIKGLDTTLSDDLVTQYIAYYRNDNSGVGMFSWVNDKVLEDLEDYQARRLKKCVQCGAVEPTNTEVLNQPTLDGNYPVGANVEKKKKNVCPYCGGTKWEMQEEEYEEIYEPIVVGDRVIPGAQTVETPTVDEYGQPVAEVNYEPTRIPYYKPDVFPVILQKNVSLFGKLLGDSDVDKIADQQNTTLTLSQKIIEKLLAGGSYLSLPDDCSIEKTDEDLKVIRPGSAANASMIRVFDIQGDISQDLTYLGQIYEEARQVIGITDSFQGRKDPTAVSGKAKQFAASQSAGRLESKRVMKNAMYAALFELIFKFKLAYADEPRPVAATDNHGNPEYKVFNRYDFLEQDEAGEWYWNDQFLFSCDSSSLANNREAMWQEMNLYLQSGAFGDPTQITTRIMFWGMMEKSHYPNAGDIKKYLEEELKNQQQAQQQAMQDARQVQQQIINQMPQEQIQQNSPLGL